MATTRKNTVVRSNAKDKNVAGNMKSAILSRIEELGKAEETSRKLLSQLSRDLLEYVPAYGDIGMVNRLLASLKTSNRDYAFLFFQEFLEWNVVTEEGKMPIFGDKITGERRIAKIMVKRKTFLADESNDIWSWTKENVKGPQRKVDYFKQVASTVTRALEKGTVEENGKERKMEARDIIRAVRAGGVTVAEILELASSMEQDKEEIEKAAEEAKE